MSRNKNVLIPILFAAILLLFFVGVEKSYACTYEEALSSDWGNYPIEDVKRILSEDMTQPSVLTENQKETMLIGDMRGFYKEFDKMSMGIKYEAICAISALETGHFSSELCKMYNNVGGLTGSEGYVCYNTKEDGIRAMGELLSYEYLNPEGCFYKGVTIIDVGQHYNQSIHFVNLYVKIRLDMENRIKDLEPIEETEKIEILSYSDIFCSLPIIDMKGEFINELIITGTERGITTSTKDLWYQKSVSSIC